VSPRGNLYETQAAAAPWRGNVDGKPAYIAKWKGKWEISCRAKEGIVTFQLTNRAAIRNVAQLATPPIPEKVLGKVMKSASRDIPVGRRAGAKGARGTKIAVALILLALLCAVAYLARDHLPIVRRILGGS